MKKYAIIVAGGIGVRMESSMPKQFLLLHNKPIVHHSIKAFVNAFYDIEIALVLPKDYLHLGKEITANFTQKIHIVEGGETRFHSVKNGLTIVIQEGMVFVHDAVRCIVTPQLIKTCFDEAVLKGNAVPSIACTDSMRVIKLGHNEIINRDTLKIIQTPQTFTTTQIISGYNQIYSPSFTDDASVVEQLGFKINLVKGEPTNIKITTPIDLIIAEAVLAKRN